VTIWSPVKFPSRLGVHTIPVCSLHGKRTDRGTATQGSAREVGRARASRPLRKPRRGGQSGRGSDRTDRATARGGSVDRRGLQTNATHAGGGSHRPRVASSRDRRRAVVTTPRRGEVWWGELPDVGRRPFLVMARDAAIPILNSVLAAPITRTVRMIPSELRLGPEDGMPTECAASFDNLRVVPKAHLVRRECILGPALLVEACGAMRIAIDC